MLIKFKQMFTNSKPVGGSRRNVWWFKLLRVSGSNEAWTPDSTGKHMEPHTSVHTRSPANGKQTRDVKCGHIQRNVTALDITQRRGFIWQRRDQVLNPVFDLLVKTTTRPLIYLACRLKIYVFAFARVRVHACAGAW